jgi:ABC-type phosphate/phosphonate transport system substrate-binding protein
LGGSFIIENKAGATGTIGAGIVTRAAPDGHTLFVSSLGPFVIAPHLIAKVPYDALKDFDYITIAVQAPNVLVVPASSPYKSMADLRGKPIAFASRTSTSGYLIPLLDLKNAGLISTKPEDLFGQGNVWYGTGYMSAVERVLAGEAEAAAVSDYVFEKDKHLTPEQKARLKVVDTQGPVPTHVLAISKRLSPGARQQLLKAVQDFSDKNPTLRDAVFTSRLVECDEDAHLLPVVNALDFVQGQQN